MLAADARTAPAGSRLALLQLPDRLESFPDRPSVTILPPELLSGTQIIRFGGNEVDPLDLIASGIRVSAETFELRFVSGDREALLRLSTDGSVKVVAGDVRLVDPVTGEFEQLDQLFERHPPTIMFGDGSVVRGFQIYRQAAVIEPLPADARRSVNWRRVDKTIEFPRDATVALTATNSVAGAALEILRGEADWIVQDHLPGEMADFIAVRNSGGIVHVDLVHCKKPGGDKAGTRVTDIEQLIAQAMRSVYLATSGPEFWTKLAHRLEHRTATRIVSGEQAAVTAMVAAWSQSPPLIEWLITAVQPGVKDSALDGWSDGNALLSGAYAACRGQNVGFRLMNADE